MKLSFCTTCKERLWQLCQTFPANLEAVRADGCSEIVLVNYNSNDGLDDWIRQFLPEIKSGLLRYIHEQSQPHFHASRAKNLAHFAATGEYVISLDGDNFIGETITVWRQIWNNHRDALIHGFCGEFGDGTYGRIGLPRNRFLVLGGYDESFLPFGHQDRDLIARGRALGLRLFRVKQNGVAALKNSVDEKIKYSGSKYSYRQMLQLNSVRLRNNSRAGRLKVNRKRKAVKVLLNFSNAIAL